VPIFSGIREIVVTGPAWQGELTAPEDLAGREVWARASSSHQESLRTLSAALEREGLKPILTRIAEEVLDSEHLLEMVNAGLLPATVVDEPLARFWSEFFPDLRVQPLAVREEATYAWAARKGMPRFLELVDEFVAEHRVHTYTGNVLLRRYLQNTTWAKRARADGSVQRLRPLVDLFKKYAELYDLEWQLIAAQAYQESGLDPAARNPSGAVGLMQILPSTAKDMGIDGIEAPEANIHAGTKYLRFLIDRYFADPEIDSLNQMLFALAAYNAGPSRVRRLRGVAAKEGLDPNQWFGHVERVVARHVSREPVRYVANIYQYYVAYRIVSEAGMRPGSAEKD
jgi:membrane-bound lytic murein transglycosylase MltF